MNRGRFRFATLMVSLLFGCSQFTSAEETESAGAGSTSSEAETSTASPTTNGTTAATDGEGPSTSVEPTTGDPSETSSNSEGETTSDPMTEASMSDTTEESSSPTSSSGPDDTESDSNANSDSDVTTGPMECMQQDVEPNDLEGQGEFVDLGTIGCGPTQYDFEGTIEDATDEDWMGYLGSWNCGPTNDPQVFVDVLDNNVEVCVSPWCVVDATAQYFCVEGNNWSVSGNDWGCCSTDVVRMNVNCIGTADQSLVASLRVRDAKAVCEDYTLSYAYLVQ